MLNSYYLTACAGQHLDLSLTLESDDLENTCLKAAAMKSASQIECACHLGALVANAEQKLIDDFRSFGYNLGIASQIANDIQGIIDGADIIKPKLTLPVAYSLNHAHDEARRRIHGMFTGATGSNINRNQIAEDLFHCGAIHYAAVKMEFHKQLAGKALSKAKESGIIVEHLTPLLQ